MRATLICFTTMAVTTALSTHAAQGVVDVKSPYSVKVTMDRLEQTVTQRQLNVFARVDHAAGAAKIGKSLRPTELLIFGNPQGGTPFMECAQSVGIDLPLRALAWEDGKGQVWLSYTDPAHIAQRHNASSCPAVPNLQKALAGLSEAVVAK